MRRLGENKSLAENVGGTADPNWPKGYSILDDAILINKTGEELAKGCHCSGTGWELSWLMSGSFCIICFSLLCFAGFLLLFFWFVLVFLYLLDSIYLNPRVFSLLLFHFSLPSHWGEWASSCVGFSCQLVFTHNRDEHQNSFVLKPWNGIKWWYISRFRPVERWNMAWSGISCWELQILHNGVLIQQYWHLLCYRFLIFFSSRVCKNFSAP